MIFLLLILFIKPELACLILPALGFHCCALQARPQARPQGQGRYRSEPHPRLTSMSFQERSVKTSYS